MFRSFAIAAALSAFSAPAGANARDIGGLWLSPSHEAHVQIVRCGESWCGKLLSVLPFKSNPKVLDVHNKDPKLRDKPVVGMMLITGFKGGPNKWTGGRVYNPGDGNWYRGAITLVDEDHLQLKGCAFAILCKSQTWTRLPAQ